MGFGTVLVSEYDTRFPGKSLRLLRALRLYYRDPGFRVIALTRACVSGSRMNQRRRYAKKLLLHYGVTVSPHAVIGQGLRMEHYAGIVIGRGAVIGDHCLLYQQVTLGQKNEQYPTLGNHVTVYPGAKIIGGIRIGSDVTVGANAVVLHDVPDGAVVAGVPARIIGEASV